MRYFNTSGPNMPSEHYTIERTPLIKRGMFLVKKRRYFTIWAPRQTGKSTFFRQLAEKLKTIDYKPVYFSVEGKETFSQESTFKGLNFSMRNQLQIEANIKNIEEFQQFFIDRPGEKFVLIIDEIEAFNPEYFNQFLHIVRNLYHSREAHSLKSVILVGVSNIIGIVSDNASPFNITDNLDIPYFTDEETAELLHQHETERGQLFQKKVVEKISEITANQPGLVNGFAKHLVDNNPDKGKITYSDYLNTEHFYLNRSIDKNFENIKNKAKEYRPFLERLLYREEVIPFDIDREAIKLLHTNGIIKADEENNVTFWVPFYKKRLYKAFYPYTNGEQKNIQLALPIEQLITDDGQLIIEKFIEHYKDYVSRRGFRAFREKDKEGNYISIKEAALMYSFETYIQAILLMVGGKSYREADTGLGKSDLIINVAGKEQLIESKMYYYPKQFTDGKKQLAYYCSRLGLSEAVYLVFVSNMAHRSPVLKESIETIDAIIIHTFLVEYDEEKDF